jgi:hypothetical protein
MALCRHLCYLTRRGPQPATGWGRTDDKIRFFVASLPV